MDPILSLHLVPVLVDGFIVFGIVLALALGRVPGRWRRGAAGFALVLLMHLVGSLLEVSESDIGAILAPIIHAGVQVGLLVVAIVMWREILRPQRLLEKASRHRAKFESSVDEAPAIIVNLTRDGTVSHINKYGARWLRNASGPIAGHDFFGFCVAPGHQDSARETFFAFIASAGQAHNVAEYPVTTAYGDRLISWRLTAQLDASGDIVGVILYGEDVSERREAEAVLERYRVLTEHTSDIILFVRESDGAVIEANRAAQDAYGYSREQLLSLTIADLRDPGSAADIPSQEEMTSSSGVRFETMHRRANGEIFPVEASVKATRSIDDETVLLCIVRDVTERRRVEGESEQNRRRLAELTRELAVSEERQRRLLAVEMHDRVSQPLAAAKLKLEVAVHKQGDAVRSGEFDESVKLIGEAISETRAITLEMSPPLLYDVGLAPALEWLAARQAEYGVSCEAECEAIEGLDPDTRAFLFRTARELLMNIVKHSNAERARVMLRAEGDAVVLTVADEGDGFDMSVLRSLPDENRGFGLFSIREHAAAMGAEMSVESSPGHGTTVTLRLPGALAAS